MDVLKMYQIDWIINTQKFKTPNIAHMRECKDSKTFMN